MVKDQSWSECEWRKGKGKGGSIFFKKFDIEWKEKIKVMTDGGWRQGDYGKTFEIIILAAHICAY